MKHFCSVHKLPRSHECRHYKGPNDDHNDLETVEYDSISHEALPSFIHAKTNVPYFVGRQGQTIIAVELKKSGWSVVLQKRDDIVKDIVAYKNDQRWHIRIKVIGTNLSAALRNLPVSADEISELATVAEEEKALPVVAIVASDSSVLLSATTFKALSP